MLNLKVEEKDRIIIFRIFGELTTLNVKEFDRAFEKYICSDYEIIALDLKKFPYIDSFGISRLMKLSRSLKDCGVELVLIDMNEHIHQMFRMGTFDRLFNIMTVDEFNAKYFPQTDEESGEAKTFRAEPAVTDKKSDKKPVQYVHKDKSGTTIIFDEEA